MGARGAKRTATATRSSPKRTRTPTPATPTRRARAATSPAAPPPAAPPKPPRSPRAAWQKALRLNDEGKAAVSTAIDELAALATVIDGERRRFVDACADALTALHFDDQRIEDAAARRTLAEERATKKRSAALKRLYKALDEDQRSLLAVLVRAGLLPL